MRSSATGHYFRLRATTFNALRIYEGQTIRADLCGMHGLRQAYAQL